VSFVTAYAKKVLYFFREALTLPLRTQRTDTAIKRAGKGQLCVVFCSLGFFLN
jgi:hypothetical protein